MQGPGKHADQMHLSTEKSTALQSSRDASARIGPFRQTLWLTLAHKVDSDRLHSDIARNVACFFGPVPASTRVTEVASQAGQPTL